MKNRPNPFLHMILWGTGSGIILAMSYFIILSDTLGGVRIWEALFNPFVWTLVFFLGGIPGFIMGVIDGYFLWAILRKVAMPFTKADMKQKRALTYSTVFIMTVIFSLLIYSLPAWLFSILDESFLLWWLLPEVLIAALAATYAAHRYMFRLRLWSGGIESRKSKAKNEEISRLSDNFSEDVASHIESDTGKQDYTR